jgi:hypothetical protein
MLSAANRLRLPPLDPPERLPALVDDYLEEGWRLHWDDNPADPKPYPTGKHRFDAPAGEYRVTYVNENKYGCFGEVYGNRRNIGPKQATRRLSKMTSIRPLRVIPLEDSEVIAAFNVDGAIYTTIDYARTQQWSLALHNWYPEADGIRYIGRRATTRLNRCLFVDRCGKDLNFALEGELQDLQDIVVRAADAYSLAQRLF